MRCGVGHEGGCGMKITVQIVVEHEDLEMPLVEEVACLCRGDLLPETMGLTLDEGKQILARLQQQMVQQQAQQYVSQQRACPECGRKRGHKGKHQLVWRSLFGKLRLESPRFYYCRCESQKRRSFSPLAQLLPERSAPELLYLESKWASLVSYGLTTDLLEDVLPMKTSSQSVINNTAKTAQRMEDELGKEQHMYAHGCLAEWERLPPPDGRLTVGLDGGFIHARDGEDRKAGWFEVIAGKSVTWEGEAKTFGLVNKFDEKPKRRLFDLLQSQGLQMNQDITFVSDGGDTVRDLQLYLSPWSEHILDWFHVTMRLTVMMNTAKGLPKGESLDQIPTLLERVKWYLWHGNVYKALIWVEHIEEYLEIANIEQPDTVTKKLLRMIQEFGTYIGNNRGFIPNYGERYHYGETISTAFVESTINWVVSKRMVKKQQMRWTKKGAHLLLQLRTKTLNGDLRDKFCEWYPGMNQSTENLPLAI